MGCGNSNSAEVKEIIEPKVSSETNIQKKDYNAQNYRRENVPDYSKNAPINNINNQQNKNYNGNNDNDHKNNKLNINYYSNNNQSKQYNDNNQNQDNNYNYNYNQQYNYSNNYQENNKQIKITYNYKQGNNIYLNAQQIQNLRNANNQFDEAMNMVNNMVNIQFNGKGKNKKDPFNNPFFRDDNNNNNGMSNNNNNNNDPFNNSFFRDDNNNNNGMSNNNNQENERRGQEEYEGQRNEEDERERIRRELYEKERKRREEEYERQRKIEEENGRKRREEEKERKIREEEYERQREIEEENERKRREEEEKERKIREKEEKERKERELKERELPEFDEKYGNVIRSHNSTIPDDNGHYLSIELNNKKNGVFIPNKTDLARFRRDSLKRHNYYRKYHQAGQLELTEKLNNYAQNYAENLATRGKMEHSKKADRQKIYGDWTGENLYYYWTTANLTITGADAIDSWYDEIEDYDFAKGVSKNGGVVGHFTQLVWKESSQLGVGVARSSKNKVFVVANYHPGGNFNNMEKSNVLLAKA